jgi:hypothetical protein
MSGGTNTTTTTSALHLEDQSRTFESPPSGPLNVEDDSLPSKNGVQSVQFNRRKLLIIIATILIVSVVLIVTLVLLLIPGKLFYD